MFAALLALVFSAGSAHALTPAEIYRIAARSVVALEAKGADGQSYRGTGFFVASDVVATNFHLVRGAVSATVRPLGADRDLRVEGIVGASARHDLALLSVPGAAGRRVEVGQAAALQVGDRIYVLGNPRGFTGTFSEGLVSAIRRTGTVTSLQLSTPISPGSSGSPVFDAAGRVVGVIRSKIASGDALVFATPSSYVGGLLLTRGAVRGFTPAAIDAESEPVPRPPLHRASAHRASVSPRAGSPAPGRIAAVVIGVPPGDTFEATGHILKALIESRLRYRVQLRRGTSRQVFEGMDARDGDFDIHPEVWLPNYADLWRWYVDRRGTVVGGARPYVGFQGLCVPGHVHDRLGVSRVQDLLRPDVVRALDSDGNGRGAIWLGADGWHATLINRVKLRDYGLSARYDGYVASEAAMSKRLSDAFARKAAAAFYCYAPHWTIDAYDLFVLKEPEYDPQCYAIEDPDVDEAWFPRSVARCQGPPTSIHIAYARRLENAAPDLARLLSGVSLNARIVSEWSGAIKRRGADPYRYSRRWVNTHARSILVDEPPLMAGERFTGAR